MAGLLFAVVLAAQAAAGGTGADKPAAQETPSAKPKKVCVYEAPAGSIMRKKICATPEEWERRRQQDVEAISSSGATNSCRGGGC